MTGRASAVRLPPPRGGEGSDASYRIAVVCLGNICRSPIAQVVLARRIDDAGLGDRVGVASAGTGDWHVGQRMDQRAAAVLDTHGYDASRHRARQTDRSWLERADLVLAMDDDNLSDLSELGVPKERLLPFRTFDPEAGDDLDVPDPYYGGPDGFDAVLRIVERVAATLVAELGDLLGGPAGATREERG